MNREFEVDRLAHDLRDGNERDASMALSEVLHQRDALSIIEQSRRVAGPGRVDDIIIDRAGDVNLVNNYNHTAIFEGRVAAGYVQPVIRLDLGLIFGRHHR